MFGWLVNLFTKSAIVGSSCACCQGQKERLREMQEAIERGEIDFEEEEEEFSSGTYSAKCGIDGSCRSQEYHAKILGDLSSGNSPQEIAKHLDPKYKD